MQLNLHKLKGEYSILKLDSLPDVRAIDGFFALTRTDDEISLVCLNSEADKLECVSKIPECAISGVAAPFLRHKARLSAAKPSDLFLELTKNPLELADCPA